MMKRTIRALMMLMLLAMLAVPTAQAQQQRFAIVSGGQTCGSVDIAFEYLANGYVQCRYSERRNVVDRLGKQVEYSLTAECLADSSLIPISIEARRKLGMQLVTIKGRVTEGVLYVAEDYGDGRVERRREECRNAVLDIMLPALARWKRAELPSRIIRLRDMESSAAALQVERTEAATSIIVNELEYWTVNSSGALTEYSAPALTVEWLQPSAVRQRPQHCALAAGVEWDAGATGMDIPGEEIKLLRATLTLSRNVGATLAPEDLRQSIVAEPAAANAVTVQMQRVYLRPTGLPLPVFDKSLMDYLRSDSLINLEHTAIRSRLNTLRAWDRPSDAVITAINAMLLREFHRDDLVPVIPASGAVAHARGSSLHATLMFVALARAVGLPARFVFGLRPVEGRWRGVVWAEAWSDDWVPVLAEEGRLLESAAYIRLFDAATVEELRSGAEKLRGILSVRVDRVDLARGAGSNDLQTGIIGGVYTNREFRCALTAPTPQWFMEQRDLANEVAVHMLPEMGSRVEFTLHLLRNTSLQSAATLLDARTKATAAVLDSFELLEDGEITLAGVRAPYRMYRAQRRDRDGVPVSIQAAHCMLVRGDKAYLLSFTAPRDEFLSIRPHVEAVLRNFRLITPTE